MPPDAADEDQITNSMESVRSLSLEDRKDYYLERRVKEQRSWYVSKAKINKVASRRWVAVSVLVYAAALALVFFRIVYPENKILPIEPLIVVASSIIGWVQVKKFNELASAYTLTAHEIGILQSKCKESDTEEAFSEFVAEAELAFSREHTQWVARQNE
jgi:hypothetical protein